MVTSTSPRIHLGTLQYGKLLDIRWEDLLIVMLLASWLMRLLLQPRKISLSPLGGPILAYLALDLICTCIGVIAGWLDPTRALFFYLKEVEFTLFFFLTLNLVRTMEDVKTVLAAFFVGGFLNVLYVLYQVSTGTIGGMETPWDLYRYYGISMIGEGGPGVTGNYFSMIAFLSTGAYLFASERAVRLGALALAAGATGGVVGSMSRTSLVGFVLTLPIILFLLISNRSSTNSRRRLSLLLCVFAGLGLLLYGKAQEIRDRLPYAVRITEISLEGYQTERVEDVYRDYFKVIQKNPVFGLGKSITGQQKIPGIRLEMFYGEAHNQYLRVMAEAGIIGLALFLYIFLTAARRSYRLFRWGDRRFRIVSFGCLVTIIYLLISAMGQDVFIMARAIELFWILLGLCMVAYRWDQRMLQ
jgi:O-antigen ligase